MFSMSSNALDEQPEKLIEYQNNWFVKHIIWWKMTIYWLMVGFINKISKSSVKKNSPEAKSWNL